MATPYKNYSEAESRICGAKVTGGRPEGASRAAMEDHHFGVR